MHASELKPQLPLFVEEAERYTVQLDIPNGYVIWDSLRQAPYRNRGKVFIIASMSQTRENFIDSVRELAEIADTIDENASFVVLKTLQGALLNSNEKELARRCYEFGLAERRRITSHCDG